jgi:hypothetical protein
LCIFGAGNRHLHVNGGLERKPDILESGITPVRGKSRKGKSVRPGVPAIEHDFGFFRASPSVCSVPSVVMYC